MPTMSPTASHAAALALTPKLTVRQQQVLDLIESAVAKTGAPPTRAEIAAEFGFKSVNAAEEHLQALAKKGVIELVTGTSRGIRLSSETLRNLNDSRMRRALASPMGLGQLNLPLIGSVAAGTPILAQQHIESTYSIGRSLFYREPNFLLRVKGMSMRDAGILDGDLLAVMQTKEAINGQIVVARVDDEVTVKRFRRDKAGIQLVPENPDFQTILIRSGQTFEIEGLAVGLIRSGLVQ